MLEQIEAQTLYYRTINLAKQSLPSFRMFYPELRLVIVDNSGGDECTMFLRDWVNQDKYSELLEIPKNLGHGRGLDYGIQRSKCKYVFLFESDTIILNGGIIEKMLELMTYKVYGIGDLFYCTASHPYNYICKVTENIGFSRTKMKYIWTYAALISVEKYKEFPPFNDDSGTNASPLGDAFKAIHWTGRPDELLIDFDTSPYVKHLEHGTVKLHGFPETA